MIFYMNMNYLPLVHGELPAGPYRGHSLGGGVRGRRCGSCGVPQSIQQNAQEAETTYAGHVLCPM